MLEDLIQRTVAQLGKIQKMKKCSSCECLLDTLAAIQSDLKEMDSPLVMEVQKELEIWLNEGDLQRHPCLGCEICHPIQPYNEFSLEMRGLKSSGTTSTSLGIFNMTTPSCGCGHTPVTSERLFKEQDRIQKWPVVEGDYLVGSPSAQVAICTLADQDLPGEIQKAGLLDSIAIVGPLATENLGIERLVRNLIANPKIHSLILCGKDSRGHQAGQALFSLKTNGMNEHGEIIGANGPRPILKNVSSEEIQQLRDRITVVDEIGTKDITRLKEVITACSQLSRTGDFLPPKIHIPKAVVAQPSREWSPDPEGFFLIFIVPEERKIVCEHYTTDQVLNETIRGDHAVDISNTVIRRSLLSRLDHAAYLGRELAKAETALAFGHKYIQDQPLGS